MTGSDWQEEGMNVRTTRWELITRKPVTSNDYPNTDRTNFENSTAVNPISKKNPVQVKSIHPRITKKNIKKQYFCPQCPRAYSYLCGLNQHLKYECGKPCKFACPYCGKKIKRRENVYGHIRKYHKGRKEYAEELY